MSIFPLNNKANTKIDKNKSKAALIPLKNNRDMITKKKINLFRKIKYFIPGFCSSGAILTRIMPSNNPKKEIIDVKK